jgi:hypothetical protein
MFTLFFKYVIPMAMFLAAFLVGYNYFFGSPEEQEQSKALIAKFTDLGGDVYNLLHSEKEKYDQGKYDDALAMINQRIEQLKQLAATATENKQQLLDQVNELKSRASAIQSQLNKGNGNYNSGNMTSSDNYGSQQQGGNSRSTGYNQQYGSYQGGNYGFTNPQYGGPSQDIGAQLEELARQTQTLTDRVKQSSK